MVDTTKKIIIPDEDWKCIEYDKQHKDPELNTFRLKAQNNFLSFLTNGDTSNFFKDELVEFYRCESETTKLLHCFNYIYSESDKYTDLSVCSYVPIKLWLNDEVIYHYDYFYPVLMRIKLKKGINIFSLETSAYKQGEVLRIEIFAGDDENEAHSFFSALRNNYLIENHRIMFRFTPRDYSGESELNIFCLPTDRENTDFDRGFDIEVYPRIHRCIDEKPELLAKPIASFNYHYGIPTSLDLNQIRRECSSNIYTVRIVIKCYTVDGSETIRYEDVIINDGTEYKEYAETRINELLSGKSLNYYDRCCLEHYKELVQDSFWYADMVMKAVYLISCRKSVTDEYSENVIQREKKLIFKSELDGSFEYITYLLPTGYSKHKRYPLLVICSAYYHDNQSYNFTSMKNCIIADISGRGILTGSYQNEAQFLESMRHLLKFCSIDLNRIYFTGFSNGAYDVWSFAENYPGMAAGIYPVTGRTIKKLINNLKDTRVITVSSKSDYLYDEAYEFPINALSEYGKISGIEINNANHSILFSCMFDKRVYKDLFKASSGSPYTITDFKVNLKNRGLGIASIYLKPLVICADNKYTKVAEQFASPAHNGYDNTVHVKYPIKEALNKKEISGSVIFINKITDNEELYYHFPVKCHSDGFIYLGKKYAGEYSVLQIITNPSNSDELYLSVFISSKSESQKNILLRKFTLTSYSNGFNPFINNEIVIHYKGKYYSANSGKQLVEILGKK